MVTRAQYNEKDAWLPRELSFLAGLPEARRRIRPLLTVQAYVDESGGSGQGAVLVFAGFIGEAQEWARFSSGWSTCLGGGKGIAYLRMHDAAHLTGEFTGWQKKERDEKLRSLARTLNAYRVRSIHFAIDLPAFQNGMAEHWARPHKNPYFLGYLLMLAGVCVDAQDWGYKEQVEIIFDEHVIFSQRVKLWYPLFKEMWDGYDPELAALYPSEPLFRDDKTFPPLQAADLMAWLLRKSYAGEGDNDFARIIMPELTNIPNSHCSDFVRKERMDRLTKMGYEFEERITPEQIARWRKHLGLDE
ncbi:MAG: DUF3800 domain-containing protein [Acidobacteria bacterium]|nr:DUF3800 domain-containing protein [Acidobacteriota bacterium]MBI3661814.1 DUF3800 domain-containing protein [Acidobacteriota bacterium]